MSNRVWTLAVVAWASVATMVAFCLLGGWPAPVNAFVGMRAPEVTSLVWLNRDIPAAGEYQGKVRLVEFWTFGCYNCRNVEPQVKAWHERYKPQGLAVISVHSPEFAYEKNVEAVQRYVREHRIGYPVAIDNDFENWRRYGNHYWPAMYLIDKKGVIRYVKVGEGGYAQTETLIQELLQEGA
jgi:thiol-disulfide isomerase/thioredoxin